jgi:hypothetical protein
MTRKNAMKAKPSLKVQHCFNPNYFIIRDSAGNILPYTLHRKRALWGGSNKMGYAYSILTEGKTICNSPHKTIRKTLEILKQHIAMSNLNHPMSKARGF